jgi:hypothetical protein
MAERIAERRYFEAAAAEHTTIEHPCGSETELLACPD